LKILDLWVPDFIGGGDEIVSGFKTTKPTIGYMDWTLISMRFYIALTVICLELDAVSRLIIAENPKTYLLQKRNHVICAPSFCFPGIKVASLSASIPP
jgi:hypothetical protein